MSNKDKLNIVWLASYPRSGNTWLRFFLSKLMYGEHKSSLDVSDNIPEIGSDFEVEAKGKSGTTLIKTHLLHGSPRLTHRENTGGFIYILRNPIDVMIANYHYHLLLVGTELQESEEAYERRFYNIYMNHGGEPRWIEFEYGSWAEHVTDWIDVAGTTIPNIVIRYEDMKRNPMLIAHVITSFLDLKKTDEEIQDALNYASIDNMKKIQDKDLSTDEETFFSRHNPQQTPAFHRGLRFMNKGKSNRKHELPPEIRSRALNVFQGPMLKYGYM